MFKDEKSKNPKDISEWLGSASEHLTHGKPINIDLAISKGLKVIPLEADSIMQDLVLSVFHSTMVTFDVTGCVKIIENQKGKGWYSIINLQ